MNPQTQCWELLGVTPAGHSGWTTSLSSAGFVFQTWLIDKNAAHVYVCYLRASRSGKKTIHSHLYWRAEADFAPPGRLMHWNPHLGPFLLPLRTLFTQGTLNHPSSSPALRHSSEISHFWKFSSLKYILILFSGSCSTMTHGVKSKTGYK